MARLAFLMWWITTRSSRDFASIVDKRAQLVYDLTRWDDDDVINEIADEGVGLTFGPNELAEVRNRGYTLSTPGKHRIHRKPRV